MRWVHGAALSLALSSAAAAGAQPEPIDFDSDVESLAEALAEYEYNLVPGERRRFHLPRWLTAGDVRDWFDREGDRFSSGDLYARMKATPSDADPNTDVTK